MSVGYLLKLVAVGAQLVLAQPLAEPIVLTPAATPPQGASRPVPHNFPSLAFEKSSFYEYAGNSTHPNKFSDALVNILQEKVGVPLWIRIGGTSADEDHYNASQKAAVVRPVPPDPHGGLWGYSIGNTYFDALVNFKGSKFIWMVPMAHPSSGTHLSKDALIQSRKAIEKIGDKLAMLELGNEPNLYAWRGPNYDPAEYVNEALQHHDDIEANITTLPNNIKYQTLVYASNVKQRIWNTKKAFDANINRNGMVGSVSWHYYQSVTDNGVTLRETLMNHRTTTSRMSRFIPEIRYLHKRNANIEFVLGEVGSVIGPKVKWEVQATFGNALWNVDAMLHSMSINVTRMHMQSAMSFGYTLWNATQVRPTFYSQAMVSDFVGNNTDRKLRVKEIALNNEHMVAYSAYDGDSLQRIALINLRMWNSTQGPEDQRPKKGFEIKVPNGVKSVQVKRLMAAGATETGSVSWGGVRWVKGGDGVVEKSIENGTQNLNVDASTRKVTVAVKDSEAALVYLVR
ncbi:hypothetical protein N0V90_002067 [Kalmusia sp. IMI 367209]|nr:hypothetical protein N0V90_002067 [Kalmusia sp. IMI 367209]